jgi:hypothetical protein
MVVLTPGAIEVAGEGATGESQRAWIEVIERLLLDRVAGERRDGAVYQRLQLAVLVTPRPAPSHATRCDLAATLTGQAADPPSGWLLDLPPNRLLQQSPSDELLGTWLSKITHHGGLILAGFSAVVNDLQDVQYR